MDFSLSFVAQRLDLGRLSRIELKPGQIVRGTVLKVYPDNTALIRIGGTNLLARLKTSLEEGQKAWLMVEPLTHPLTLKVLDADRAGGREAVWEQLLRALGVSGKEARAVVEALAKHGLPLDRQTVSAALAITGRHGVDAELIEAFVLAARRNLPLTEEVVRPLRAFFSNESLARAIRSFLAEADAFLEGGGGGRAASSSAPEHALREAVAQLRDIISRTPLVFGREPGAAVTTAPPAPFSPAAPPKGASALYPDGRESAAESVRFAWDAPAFPSVADRSVSAADRRHSGQPAAGEGRAGLVPDRQGLAEAAADPRMSRPERPTMPPSGGVPTPGAGANLPFAGAAERGAAGPAPAPARGEASGGDSRGRLAGRDGQQPPAPADRPGSPGVEGRAGGMAGEATPGRADQANPLREWLQQLGVAHERQVAARLLAGAEWTPTADNAKALLMQLVQAPSAALPAGLREAAEALLQHITGQQLMLTPPAGHPFAQLVIQIPLFTDRGEEAAFVQIEAQKRDGRRLDPDNCRLFFCLMMERMGPTTVDVHIFDRIVNVTIQSGPPWVEPFLARLREEFADRLRSVGYHLSGLKFQQIEPTRPPSGQVKAQVMSEYRGVDVRI